MKRIHLMMIIVAAPAWTCLADQGGPATRPADRLAGYIRTVQQTDDAREAMSAYARGCAIDRNKVDLHDAYMRRMLKFGLPHIAYYPAGTLVRLDPKNGLAWGVIGYMQGRRGELAKAFSATIRSLEHLRDDPSVLHNAGQLVAWYDSETDLPRLPDRDRRSLAKMKDELAGKKPYARAYREIKTAYSSSESTLDDVEKKIAAAEAEVAAAQKTARNADRQIRGLTGDIERQNRLIDNYWRDLRYGRGYGYYYRDSNGQIIYYRRSGRLYRDDLYDRISRAEQKVERLKTERRGLRSQGRTALVELKSKEATLERLNRQVNRTRVKVERKFRWDPPAVDGVVTPEADHFPVSTRPAGPVDPETQAERRLKLAGLYIRHKMNEKAAEILHGIISDYGKTKAAKKAKLLLISLKPIE